MCAPALRPPTPARMTTLAHAGARPRRRKDSSTNPKNGCTCVWYAGPMWITTCAALAAQHLEGSMTLRAWSSQRCCQMSSSNFHAERAEQVAAGGEQRRNHNPCAHMPTTRHYVCSVDQPAGGHKALQDVVADLLPKCTVARHRHRLQVASDRRVWRSAVHSIGRRGACVHSSAAGWQKGGWACTHRKTFVSQALPRRWRS